MHVSLNQINKNIQIELLKTQIFIAFVFMNKNLYKPYHHQSNLQEKLLKSSLKKASAIL